MFIEYCKNFSRLADIIHNTMIFDIPVIDLPHGSILVASSGYLELENQVNR